MANQPYEIHVKGYLSRDWADWLDDPFGTVLANQTALMGILAVVWGGLDLAGVFLNLPFEIPVFAILLMVLGVIVLTREIYANRNPIGGLQ